MKLRKRLTALLLSAVMVAAMLPAAFAEEDEPWFSDVTGDVWYRQAVEAAAAKDLMAGYEDGTFHPTATLKRNMLAQVFYNWETRPYNDPGEEKPWAGTAPFADVNAGSWYENAVNWARSEKVMQGDGSNFNPEKDLTRQEMAVALYGYAGYKDVGLDADVNVDNFADGGEVAGWAKTAMSWALTRDMLHVENDTLAPTAPVQRCELAYALMQLCQSGGEVDRVRLLAGTILPSGSEQVLEDCAIKISYDLHTTDWPADGEISVDEVVKRGHDLAKANGYTLYTPEGESGKSSKVYIATEPWFDGVSFVTVGELDSLHPGVIAAEEEGETREYAKKYKLWDLGDERDWRVYRVEAVDYYVENGEEHPCFWVTLLPVW